MTRRFVWNGRLINDYRCIGLGLQQLSQPKKYKYGLLRRWIRSKEMEGEVRKLMEHIELNTRSYMVSFKRDRGLGSLLVDLA